MRVRYICLAACMAVPVFCRGLSLPERLPISVLPENVFLGIGNDDFKEPDGRTMAAVVRMLGEESTYNVITLTLRCTNDLSSAETQRRVRMIAEQAHGYGMKVMMDTDPRIARHEFLRRWPADAQRYLEIAYTNAIPCPSFADHMSGGTVPYYETARRIAATRRMPDGRTAFAHEITLYSADVFSPRLPAYSRELMARYKALGVDGAMKDEWGFPPTHGDGFREHRAIWYSDHLAARYRERTGRDLLDDAFLMACGAPGRERERTAAVDAYMQLTLDRNAEIEGDFYAANKELFGPDTYVTKHSTWYPRICPEEFMHNGLDWWRTRRDWAQSDEFTPIPAVCGMAKKCGGANWMNEGYQKEAGLYAEAVWRYALAGGRMVYHPVYPSPRAWAALPYPERRLKAHGDVLKANGRRAQECVRLVNRISSAPIDSPVAFVFSRRRIVNWTDAAYGDWGEERVYGLWRKGWATDLYPADDFSEGTFVLDGEGFLRVGRQRYLAVVLHRLGEPDRAAFAGLVGSTALKTRVFESGDPGLERYLEESGAVRQPPLADCGTRFAHVRTWYPNPDGLLRLTDGTAVRIKAVASTRGDPISGTLRLNGVDIRYEATGLFAARVSKAGELEAFAGAGLRRVVAPGVDLSFPEGRDYVFQKADRSARRQDRTGQVRTVTVSLTPDGDRDRTVEVKSALEKVRAAGGGTIKFAPGEYHFRAKSATSRHYYVSNHSQRDAVPVQLPLEGLRGVTLKGDGTRFVLHGATMGFAVVDSENVTVSGISVDWSRPFLTEAKVLGFEKGGTLVSVDAKTCPYDVRAGKFVALGDGWEAASRWLMAFRGDTHALVERTVDIRWEGDVAEGRGEGRFLMKTDLSKLGVRAGDLLALRPEGRPPHPAVFVYRAKGTVLEDVAIHTAWGMGVICQRSEGFTWRGTRGAASRTSGVFAPKGSGRFLTLNADATHFSNVKGLVKIQNCLFEGMMDDAINVHATCLAIREKTDRDVIRCRYMHADSYGFETFRPGETLRFIRGKTLENGAEVKVRGVTVHDPYEITLTLAAPVPDGIGVGDAVENADYQPSVEFLDNVVARNRARGALFTTPRPVKVVGNLFERVSGSAILFAGDAQGWYESGACEDVMVRNNVFRDCMTSRFQFCDGIISFYPMVADLAAQKRRYHRNVFIENNLFETFDAPLLFAISTEDLTFRNNTVRYHDRIEGWGKPPFVFSRCANMRTADGNRYFAAGDDGSADKPRLASIFSDHMVFAAGKPVRVFGTGEGDVRVTFRGQTVAASSSDGCWCATLPPGSAGGPFELKVGIGSETLTLRDVMVGEVLVMAGQSNMQFKLGESTSARETWEGNPKIRAFTTTRLERQEPYAAKDGWVVLEAADAGRWSAIGYETAIRRAKATGTAVGVINAYQGASTVQAWMPRQLARSPRLSLSSGQCAHHDSRNEYYSLWNRSGTLYDNQFAEVRPFSVSAVVWYQGESNSGSVEEGALYADALEAMIGQWRVDLGDSRLPFFVLQLASPLTGGPRKDAWRAVQDSQRRVAERCPFVTCIRTEDICETDKGIHPPTKCRIAERLCEELAR